ncbi:acyltransferase [Pasteurellaceae bacterium RH1A]|nr:acyltransferase [Pasteurellaceae bacterium RH1A]
MKMLIAKLIDHLICFFTAFITGVRPQNLPENSQPTVYYANHNSHGDFILVWISLPQEQRMQTRPVAGADYWNKGKLRPFIANSVFNVLLIERNSDDPKKAIECMAEQLEQGKHLIIFPEGTRNLSEERLQPFKSGLYHLACQRPDTQFVPVWIENMNHVLPKGAFLPVPLMCQVKIGEPVCLAEQEGKEAFLARTRQALLDLAPNKETL